MWKNVGGAARARTRPSNRNPCLRNPLYQPARGLLSPWRTQRLSLGHMTLAVSLGVPASELYVSASEPPPLTQAPPTPGPEHPLTHPVVPARCHLGF